MAAAKLLGLIAIVVGLAVAAELIGDHLGVPNFLFFVLTGLLLGPVGLGLLHHEVFGENLGAVVGLAVALIIFHSASSVAGETLQGAPPVAFVLATVGVVVTFLGTAAVTYRVMDVAPGIALLIGALLVATGSTVIDPILATVPLREELAHTMKIEALATEVTAGILAIAVFYGITLTETDPREFATVFASHFAAGVLVGVVVAVVVWLLFNLPEHAPERAPEHASQLYLATAVVTFAIAESIAKEAGVAAVATTGLLLGRSDLPYWEYIEGFQEDVTTFIIAFVFVVLASFVEPEWLETVGRDGLLVALALMVLVRPAAAFVATLLSSFTLRERLFLGAVSPRGIIPAGIATILAIEIQDTNPDAAATITGTVLLVILTTSIVEGLFAEPIARWIGVTTDRTVIVGGGRFGLALAQQYVERDDQPILIEVNQQELERARQAGFPAYHGDGSNEDVLREAGVAGATRVVAATNDDDVNLKVVHLADVEFDVEKIVTRVNNESNRSMFAEYDVELLTGSQLDLDALDRVVDYSVPDWLAALTRSGGVGTMSVTGHVDTTVAEFDESLPERAFVAAVSRDGKTWIPDGHERLVSGDRLTVLGRADAVEEATGRSSSSSFSSSFDTT